MQAYCSTKHQNLLYNNACLYVYKEGTLVVNGTIGNRPSFQGYRLEPAYKDAPAQWRGIWLSALSKNNSIDWAIIKNANIGVRIRSPSLH